MMIEEGIWHYCEYCFKPCNIFCGCVGEKRAMEKEERKREMLNAIKAELNEMDVDIYFRGEKL
jgi:hypothetical protein|tara:strand:- start:764 stop:952 length:189 start_codon:yes stop_codon:yes gene_type:complete